MKELCCIGCAASSEEQGATPALKIRVAGGLVIKFKMHVFKMFITAVCYIFS